MFWDPKNRIKVYDTTKLVSRLRGIGFEVLLGCGASLTKAAMAAKIQL
jgi:hypothetical protein